MKKGRNTTWPEPKVVNGEVGGYCRALEQVGDVLIASFALRASGRVRAAHSMAVRLKIGAET